MLKEFRPALADPIVSKLLPYSTFEPAPIIVSLPALHALACQSPRLWPHSWQATPVAVGLQPDAAASHIGLTTETVDACVHDEFEVVIEVVVAGHRGAAAQTSLRNEMELFSDAYCAFVFGIVTNTGVTNELTRSTRNVPYEFSFMNASVAASNFARPSR